MPANAAPLLEVREIRKHFGGVRAVDGVSLALPSGEIRALIGPNGAGKTTLFNLLTGLLPADGGSIRFRSEELRDLPAHRIWRRGISRTFQLAATFASLTAFENVQVALLSHAGRAFDFFTPARGLARDRTCDLLEQVGLGDQAAKVSALLPYGDLKRLELAIALANDPALLLLDEPTTGMAPEERAQLLALTERIVLARGLTVLFTEHDMDVVFGIADTIMVMHQGRILAQGKPADIRADPQVQRVYLGMGGGEGPSRGKGGQAQADTGA